MSRIGKKPIKLPENVEIELGQKIHVKGPLGELVFKLPPEIKVEIGQGELFVSRKNDKERARALHGLSRSIIANLIEGVTKGFNKTLELSGIGFRASMTGEKLVLSLGYSHPVEVTPPAGINLSVSGNKITVSGINKELVGQVAAEIRAQRPPDAYKGKGVRYEGEAVRLKPGKAAKVGPTQGA